jgi:hypothetical protein
MKKGQVMAKLDIFDDEFTRQAEQAWDRARDEALANGIPVFYREKGIQIMERPDGRRFEIRFISGAPRGSNYEIIRELSANAA